MSISISLSSQIETETENNLPMLYNTLHTSIQKCSYLEPQQLKLTKKIKSIYT